MVDYGQISKINKNLPPRLRPTCTAERRFHSWHRKPVLHFGDDAGVAGRSRRHSARVAVVRRHRDVIVVWWRTGNEREKNRAHDARQRPYYRKGTIGACVLLQWHAQGTVRLLVRSTAMVTTYGCANNCNGQCSRETRKQGIPCGGRDYFHEFVRMCIPPTPHVLTLLCKRAS